jgi:hypothetical protein
VTGEVAAAADLRGMPTLKLFNMLTDIAESTKLVWSVQADGQNF